MAFDVGARDQRRRTPHLPAACAYPARRAENIAIYSHRNRVLRLTLRREFSAGTWPLLEEFEHKWAMLQQKVRSSFPQGVTVQGDVEDVNNVEVRVEAGKGLVIDLKSYAPRQENLPVIVPDRNEIMVAWPEEAVQASSGSSDDEPGTEDAEAAAPQATVVRRAAARIDRQARKAGLRVAPPRAVRGDGRRVRGRSVFSDRGRAHGEVVMHYRGRVLSWAERLRPKRARRFYFRVDGEYTIDGGTGGLRPFAAHVAAYVNSPAGCVTPEGDPVRPDFVVDIDPAMGLGQRAVRLAACRDIAFGEELLFSYGASYDRLLSELKNSDGSEREVSSSESEGDDEV